MISLWDSNLDRTLGEKISEPGGGLCDVSWRSKPGASVDPDADPGGMLEDSVMRAVGRGGYGVCCIVKCKEMEEMREEGLTGAECCL